MSLLEAPMHPGEVLQELYLVPLDMGAILPVAGRPEWCVWRSFPLVCLWQASGNVLHKSLDSGFRRTATGILPSRRIQDILSINDDGGGMKYSLLFQPACYRRGFACKFWLK